MKLAYVLTAEIDEKEWAENNGLSVEAARNDIREHFSTTTTEDRWPIVAESGGTVRLVPAVVTVTNYSDDEYRVEAPEGVKVAVDFALAEGDTYCGCGFPIYKDEYGHWLHRDAPESWGDDHDADPLD